MALGLYKPGQGYWVRVLTAAMGGVLVLAACAWLWGQVLLIPIPQNSWVLPVRAAHGAAAPGESVVLFADIADTPGAERIGTAVVESVEVGTAGRVTLTVTDLSITAGSPAQITEVGPGEGPSAATIQGAVSGPDGIPAVQMLYVQAAVVGVTMLIGAAVLYWLVGVNPRTVEFLIATDNEMKKVNWSTRKGVIDSTWVVILWSVVLAGGLFVIDAAFSVFFKTIGVLE